MPDPLHWLTNSLADFDVKSLRRRRRVVTPLPGGRCRVEGRELVNFTTNDYLDLAGDERLAAAAKDALQQTGVGARASALVSGRTEWHERLESRIAEFENEQAALLFPTGYAANVGTLTALMNGDDVVFCDRLNHASLIDGCRLSGATFKVYRHSQLDRLERELNKAAGYQHRWIVTDGVFSMDGDLAPLPDLCDLAERFDAGVIVDEAHGTGVFGESGRGVCEQFDVEERIAVRIGTLSKAVGCLGGFVAGSRDLVDYLWNTARPQVFSTALPPAVCAAACVAFDIIAAEPERRERVHRRANELTSRLRDAGLAIPVSSVAPIVPLVLGDPRTVVEVASDLETRGFLTAGIRPPTVPNNTARLRISLTAGHSPEAVAELAGALIETLARRERRNEPEFDGTLNNGLLAPPP